MIELFINAPIELKVILLFGLVMIVKEVFINEQTRNERLPGRLDSVARNTEQDVKGRIFMGKGAKRKRPLALHYNRHGKGYRQLTKTTFSRKGSTLALTRERRQKTTINKETNQ